MTPAPTRRGRLRAALARIHPVDKSLLVLMIVLLAQSALSIFLPGTASQTASDIDVIVRTSAAAIFGYFLSASFTTRSSASGQSPTTAAAHTLETGADETARTTAPTARIGFADDGTALEAGSAEPAEEETPSSAAADAGRLQVTLAALIGLFCLVVLLAVRNLDQWGLLPAESAAVTATVVQFRDFVSGCVGFLIGCPAQQSDQTSSQT